MKLVENISNRIAENLDDFSPFEPVKWNWGSTDNFTRISISLENGDSVTVVIMYHTHKERRFKVVKSESENIWYIMDTAKNVIVKFYNLPTLANIACEKYNQYHEKQGWDQFKNRSI